MLSYWERESFTRYDHIIIGAGITGLSTAIELADLYPGERVLVLERGLLPTGATTRNAGFACMGSATELLEDLRNSSEEAVVSLFMRRKKGLDKLRERLNDAALGYRADGGYELLGEHDLAVMDQMGYLNALLRPHLGGDAFAPANDRIAGFGFPTSHVSAMTANAYEGSIDSGKAIRSLTGLAMSKGVEIRTGAEVLRLEEAPNGASIELKDAVRNKSLIVQSNTVTVCTNAFAKQLLPDEDVVPGRGQVLVTKPIEGLRFKGVFHFNAGYYYFREVDGRVLFGGGRNMDFEGETTTAIDLNTAIQEDLEQKLRDIILPGHHFEIDMRWSGIMAFGSTKAPIIKAYSDHLFGVFRMGGMGIALGSTAAAEVVELIKERR